jgi:hypothetical protein
MNADEKVALITKNLKVLFCVFKFRVFKFITWHQEGFNSINIRIWRHVFECCSNK